MENLMEMLENNQLLRLRIELSHQNAVDIADFMEELTKEKMITVFRILPKDICADVFSYMTNERQRYIIESVSDAEVRKLIDDLFLDDTVDFLEEVPAGVVKKVLKNVDEGTRTLINTFLNYPADSAGSIMTVEFVEFHDTCTVKEAIEIIRKEGFDKETIYTCYVISPERKLTGIVALRTLLLSGDDTPIKDIMNDRFISVTTHDDQEFVADTIKKYDLLSIPVVDNESRLVGIVTVDDAIDVIEEENTEDFELMAAMSPSEEPYLKSSVWTLSKNRIVWLLVLMISATVTGRIISRFEDILSGMMLLTSFIPMLTDTGGNAGSQSSTMVIRGLALGEVEVGDFWEILWKEFRVSIVCGTALAGANFLKLILIDRISVMVALVVCLSILFTVICSKVIGGILPLGAKRLKLDPAIMASPLITTIVDALALMIYFKVASILLHLG